MNMDIPPFLVQGIHYTDLTLQTLQTLYYTQMSDDQMQMLTALGIDITKIILQQVVS